MEIIAGKYEPYNNNDFDNSLKSTNERLFNKTEPLVILLV